MASRFQAVSFLVALSALLSVDRASPLSAGATTTTISLDQAGTQKWQPKIADLEQRRRLLRNQQRAASEHIGTIGFHHVEFYCGDAKSMAFRFAQALGLQITGLTGQSTGNDQCVSYGLESGEVRFLLTAPYSRRAATTAAPSPTTPTSSLDNDASHGAAGAASNTLYDAPDPLPGFSQVDAHAQFAQHGIFARAVCVQVKDATKAFDESVRRGAAPVLQPTRLSTCRAQRMRIEGGLNATSEAAEGCVVSEVQLYGDVVLRYISFPKRSSPSSVRVPFLPHLAPIESHKLSERPTFGLRRIDHAVGNVPNLQEALERIAAFTGFHEFAEFTMADVGTVDSGLNSVVLASDSEDVLLPLNEPTQGRRKSQIQTYLEQNEGPGLQHLALKTDDIFATIRHLRQAEDDDDDVAALGGFELMNRPSEAYYRELPDRLGKKLTGAQYQELERLGILADADDEGILLQIFTKPIGDRPTFFFEIIQRIGCQVEATDSSLVDDSTSIEATRRLERPGCGGFGQGNFRELFKSIEEHEKTLKV